MIRWSQLPLGDLTIATLISLETAGFIGNKYGPFYSFVYMFSVIFVIILFALIVLGTKYLIPGTLSNPATVAILEILTPAKNIFSNSAAA